MSNKPFELTVVPVLLYHSVTPGSPQGSSWGAVTQAAFEAHLDMILRSGRKSISVSTLAAGLRCEEPLPERPVVITFDDGYSDTHEAAKLIDAHGLCATVYVTTGEIGATDRLTREQVTALDATGSVEFGSHAVHHQRLDELDGAELADELSLSKTQLEQLTGGSVDSFAYPYGAYDSGVREAVVAAGYRSAAAVKNALCYSGDDPFAFARFTVTAATSAERIAEVLDGEGVPLAWSRERLRTRAYRTARRQRRRLVGAIRA